jgi:predicted chitinase
MDNGDKSTKDGSTYLGKGFIHLTGKYNYKIISQEWNRLYPDDKKEFNGADIGLLETNIAVAIKASMIFWRLNNLNKKADKGTSETIIDDIGKVVNGSGESPPNGWQTRRSYAKSAFENLD